MNNNGTEMSGLFLRLKNVMTTELHLEWDIAFLEQYIKEKMILRGLQWDVYPQQGDTDLEPWFRYFNEASTKLIGFLVERKQARLAAIDLETRDLKNKLLLSCGKPEYISYSTNLKTLLEKEERDHRSKKQKKYNRDVTNYKANLVFGWQKKMAQGNYLETIIPPMETLELISQNSDRRLVYDPPLELKDQLRIEIMPPPLGVDLRTSTT